MPPYATFNMSRCHNDSQPCAQAIDWDESAGASEFPGCPSAPSARPSLTQKRPVVSRCHELRSATAGQRSAELLARDFAISRAQSMTSRASGLNVRFLMAAAGCRIWRLLSVSRILLSHRHPLARQIYKVFAKLRIIFTERCKPLALFGELDAFLWGCHRTHPA